MQLGKNKLIVSIILIITKGLDLTTTYMVTPDLSNESSVWVNSAHLNWLRFIAVNIIVVMILILALFRINDNYVRSLEKENKNDLASIEDYIYKILYKRKFENIITASVIRPIVKERLNYFAIVYFFCFSLAYTVIVASILASLNNMLGYFGYPLVCSENVSIMQNIVFVVHIVVFICCFSIMVKNRYKNITLENI